MHLNAKRKTMYMKWGTQHRAERIKGETENHTSIAIDMLIDIYDKEQIIDWGRK